MALTGDVHASSRALELGLATGLGAIGPGIGVGFIFGKAIIFYALGMAFVAYAIA